MGALIAPSTEFNAWLFVKEYEPGQLQKGKKWGDSINITAYPALGSTGLSEVPSWLSIALWPSFLHLFSSTRGKTG